jgi:prephenate dehydratase
VHTLGPPGTNSELAAYRWFDRAGTSGSVVLHPTLEQAADHVAATRGTALIACAAYPQLHMLIYSRIDRLRMVDCMMMPTHRMVLARRRDAKAAASICVHPAPEALVPASYVTRIPAESNSDAARFCARGRADACITTLAAARAVGLELVRDFGAIMLSFTVHVAARI